MKTMLISGGAFLLIFCIVLLNSFWIGRAVNETLAWLSSIGENASVEETKVGYEAFLKREKFISLTVSHEDLTNIENEFAELIAAAEVRDDAAVKTAKSRLADSLEHLRRLSELSGDSIF